ncbi:MAG: hypothetical protein AAFX93_03105 [Verrucomicrobiota bacterium]
MKNLLLILAAALILGCSEDESISENAEMGDPYQEAYDTGADQTRGAYPTRNTSRGIVNNGSPLSPTAHRQTAGGAGQFDSYRGMRGDGNTSYTPPPAYEPPPHYLGHGEDVVETNEAE